MRTPKNINWLKLVFPVVVVGGFGIAVVAQTPAPAPAASPVVRKKAPATTVSRVIVQNKSAAPQVVTILHTLNGLKVLGILIGKEDVEAIARLDQSFHLSGEVHTNVIAGLALDDGKTIAAWLPEAEAEMPPRMFTFTPRGPVGMRVPGTPPTKGQPAPPAPPSAVDLPDVPDVTLPPNFTEPADLRVITRDGKRILGHYIGLDGLTGLSLIKLTNGSMAQTVDSKEETIVVGQQLRVIGPQPAQGPETGPGSRMYIRIGETEATVINVNRSPSGGIARVKIKSAKFSPANIGGIAINDQGETLGIVDTVQGESATIVPVALVRMAAKRVIARNASVPRPWLGIKGEPIGAIKLDRIQRIGWEVERARALAEKGQGILLTSIVPGSPAALAKLKPGDVILSVNKGNIRNAEEFSWLLDEAGPGSPTLFTVARPGREDFESMEIQLGESPDLFLGLKKIPERIPRAFTRIAEGVVTVPLKPKVALNFGSVGGLLVVSVPPTTDAFKAGLRGGDVIESIDGRPVYAGTYTAVLPKAPGTRSSCVVVRNKERITLTFEYSTHHDSP